MNRSHFVDLLTFYLKESGKNVKLYSTFLSKSQTKKMCWWTIYVCMCVKSQEEFSIVSVASIS